MKTKIISLLAILILTTTAFHLKSQDLVLYNMTKVYQSSYLNPAIQPKAKFILGLPAISGFYMNFSNTGFMYQDVFTKMKNDSFGIDINNLKNKLDDRNYVNTDMEVALFTLGMRFNTLFFGFDVINKSHTRFTFPRSLLNIADGNGRYMGANNPLDLSGIGFNVTNYMEYSLVSSKKFANGLTVGARVKHLVGMANVNFAKSGLKWYTDTAYYDWNFVTDFEVDATVPVDYMIYESEDGYPDSLTINSLPLDQYNPDMTPSFIKTKVFNKNRGWGVDLGATYQINKRFSVYASLIDFGYIKWKDKSVKLTQSGTFTFNGLNLQPMAQNWNNADSLKAATEKIGEDLLDSIIKFADIKENYTPYKTKLRTKFIAGGNFYLNPNTSIGVLGGFEAYDGKKHPLFSASFNSNIGKGFSFALSYSYMNRSPHNLGLGFAYKIGPFQWYWCADNIGTLIIPNKNVFNGQFDNKDMSKNVLIGFWPEKVKTIASFHFGFMISVGGKDNVDYGLLD